MIAGDGRLMGLCCVLLVARLGVARLARRLLAAVCLQKYVAPASEPEEQAHGSKRAVGSGSRA